MLFSIAKCSGPLALLSAIFFVFLFPSVYAENSLDIENFSPRYHLWLNSIKEDGWIQGDKQYYSELKRRISKGGKRKTLGGASLPELKRYCEWLPQCTPRAVYVIRFEGRGGCFNKEGDSVKNAALENYIHSKRKGAYMEGYWDFFFADRFHFGPECMAKPSERYPRNIAQWKHGVNLVAEYLAMVPADSKIVLAGFGLGATSAMLVAREMLEIHRRSIDYLILYDPVGPGGHRKNVQDLWAELEPGPAKVKNLYHRWQTQACLPYDYQESGLLVTAGVAVANQKNVDFKKSVTQGDCRFLWRATDTHTKMSKGLEWVNDLGMDEIIKRASKGELVLCPKEMGCS